MKINFVIPCLLGLEKLVEICGGEICKKAFVLAEGDAAKRDDVIFLAEIPILQNKLLVKNTYKKYP